MWPDVVTLVHPDHVWYQRGSKFNRFHICSLFLGRGVECSRCTWVCRGLTVSCSSLEICGSGLLGQEFPCIALCFHLRKESERQRCGTFCSQLNFWVSVWPVFSMAWGYTEDNSLQISDCGSFLRFSFHSEQDSLQSCLNAKRNRDLKNTLL